MVSVDIIVPVFNERESIGGYLDAMEKIQKALYDTKFRVLFIDDGSSDNTIQIIKREREQRDMRVDYIAFSRNFGKEAAIYAGLNNAAPDANYIGLMDVDLQDPPELIPEMLKALKDGADVAVARRNSRGQEPFIRTVFSDAFYWLLNKMSDTPILSGVRDFRIMNRKVLDAILALSERNRFSKGLFSWVGFNQVYLSFDYKARNSGKTSWSFDSLVRYAIDGIVNFSHTPLVVVSALGFISFLLSVVGALFIIIRALVLPDTAVFGWPSMIVVLLAVSGVQLLSLGVVGRYVSSIFVEVKARPLYVEKETSLKSEKNMMED